MSFREAIKSKKGSLKHTDTIVTTVDGKIIKETKDKSEIIGECVGYIVDTKPDRIPVKIINNLYLGAQDCCEKEVLDCFDIRVVLSIGIEPSEKYRSIIYKYIDCLDLPETELKSTLDIAIRFIDQHIDCNQILVHCNAGVSRSASIVIGYLILKKGFDYEGALQLCRKVRSCVKPNIGFEKQLKMLSNTL
ncbi:probable dual specificity protein phosphatase DDB_G0283417 [Diorhabda carinulata]|uniref:probable dual specificity protein phosphatase DDB_G0283417 n=1 Tax=Diorhabda carinulata TaxID=1163345 RepID=UPI0025A0CFB1|nr:probable dual specificity protein phosphatase DDB_G0283417 [Diorhabda carinulata]